MAFVSASVALISISASTRDFFIALSRVSGSPIPPDEPCKFGATSLLEELDDDDDDDDVKQFCTFRHCVVGQLHVWTFVRLLVCESHAFRVTVANIISMFMTFQHLATCVEFHHPRAVCYERGKNCLSTLKRVFPTKIGIDSMFTCQTALHLWFRVFHLCDRILKFMIGCNTVSLRTALPRTVIPQTSVFHESADVSVFVTKCPTDQKSGLFVIVDVAANKNSFQESNNIARCCVSNVCFMWREFVCSTVTQVHCTLFKEVLDPFGMSHCALCNKMIKDDFNTMICKRSLSVRTRCSARPFA